MLLADFREAETRSRSVMAGKSCKEIERMPPQPSHPCSELVVVETCHCELRDCPNALIDPKGWKQAIESWARDKNVSERFRERVKEDCVLFHHKLRISISACPNGCSRPQIVDVGIVGSVRPDVSAEDCVACGACEEACPDSAVRVEDAAALFDRDACQGCRHCFNSCPQECILLSEPYARILVGGKLGRHPHLGEMAGLARDPNRLVAFLDDIVSDYLQRAEPGERFADFSRRTNRNQTGL